MVDHTVQLLHQFDVQTVYEVRLAQLALLEALRCVAFRNLHIEKLQKVNDGLLVWSVLLLDYGDDHLIYFVNRLVYRVLLEVREGS